MVVPHHQEGPHRNGKQKGSGNGDTQKAILLLYAHNSPVLLRENLFFRMGFFTFFQPRFPEKSVPPGYEFV